MCWPGGRGIQGMACQRSLQTAPPSPPCRARKRLCPLASARELRDLLPAGARASRCSPARTRHAGAARASLEIARETYPDFCRRGYGEVKTATLSTCHCPPTLGQVKGEEETFAGKLGERNWGSSELGKHFSKPSNHFETTSHRVFSRQAIFSFSLT